MTIAGRATVIITGGDSPTALSTARALRGMGIDIIGVAEKPEAVTCRANIWSRIVVVRGSVTAQFDRLIDLVAADELPRRSILLFSQDTHVVEASRRLDRLRDFFVVPIPSFAIVERLMDKSRFHEWAIKEKFAVPNSYVVSEAGEALRALESVRLPCIFKPLLRSAEWERKQKGRKFFTIRSVSELQRVLLSEAPFALAERYVLQEWIEGGDEDIFFVLFAVAPNGRILAIQGGRKIWQWPPLGGSTALCRTWDDKELIAKAKEVVKASGLIGLASVEFKRDKRTAQFLITEPTVGRNDHQSGLANFSSRNPTRLLVEHLLEELPAPLEPFVNPKRAIWIDEISCLRRIHSGQSFRSAIRLLWAILKDRRVTLLLGAKSDWLPLRASIISLTWRRKK